MIVRIHHTYVQLSSRVLASIDISAVRCNMLSQLSQTFRMAPSLTSYSRPNAHLLGVFSLLYFAMILHRWTSVKHPLRFALGFIRFPFQFIESKGQESNMSKVHTYQLSAHQWLRFKVHTYARDYYVIEQIQSQFLTPQIS
jgi:hypothetical protein